MNNLLNLLPFRVPGPTVRMLRKYHKDTYCISHLYIGKEEKYFCDAIEDVVRDDNHNGKIDAGEEKVYGETAIPCGRYYVTFRKTSLKIGNLANHGRIPFIHNVNSFSHIRIHNGVDEKNSEGCIILGYNKKTGMVVDSMDCCLAFFKKMKYRPFWLEITDNYSNEKGKTTDENEKPA